MLVLSALFLLLGILRSISVSSSSYPPLRCLIGRIVSTEGGDISRSFLSARAYVSGSIGRWAERRVEEEDDDDNGVVACVDKGDILFPGDDDASTGLPTSRTGTGIFWVGTSVTGGTMAV